MIRENDDSWTPEQFPLRLQPHGLTTAEKIGPLVGCMMLLAASAVLWWLVAG